MQKIDGVEFVSQPNSLRSEDGLMLILCTDEKEQGIMMRNTDLKRFSGVFEKFNCVSLSVYPVQEQCVPFNMDLLVRESRIRRFAVNGEYFPVSFEYRSGVVYFPNLRELWITGECPPTFPDLQNNRKLTTLTIQYDRHFLRYWNTLDQVRDLVVYDYDEQDLRPLIGLKNIKRLKIVRGRMKNLDGLDEFLNLETLIIVKAPKLADVDGLMRAPKLQNIEFVQYSKINDWSFLSRMFNLKRAALDVVDSIDFRVSMKKLSFLYARKVKERNNKGYLFETEGRYEKGAREGIDIKYEPDHDVFTAALSD